jgi:hypothetical protein
MKKVLKFIVGIFAAEYLVLTKFAFFTDLMKNMSPSQHPALAQHIIEALVCVAVIANHIVTVSNPEKKYQDAKTVRKRYLRNIAQESISELKAKGYDVKFNFMTVKRVLFVADLMPDRFGNGKLAIFPRVFKCPWTSSENHSIPDNFVLGIKQGTSGVAYKTRKPKWLNLEAVDKYENLPAELRLNRDQYNKTKHLTALVSIPITAPKYKGSGESTVIGILTMESNTTGLGNLIDGPKPDDPQNVKDTIENERKYFDSAMERLIQTYSELYF